MLLWTNQIVPYNFSPIITHLFRNYPITIELVSNYTNNHNFKSKLKNYALHTVPLPLALHTMIHRFLLFDRQFQCLLDRQYPVPSTSSTRIEENSQDSSNTEHSNKPNTKQYLNWQVLVEEDVEEAEVENVTQSLQNTNLNTAIKEKNREHSQKLLLGSTHSLKNMLLRLAPIPTTTNSTASNNSTLQRTCPIEGFSFSFKTSAYRLHYYESFTGYRLVLLETSQSTTNTTTVSTPYGQVTVDNCLKLLYGEVMVNYLARYPLVEDKFNRPGFITRVDEFIQHLGKLFV